MRMTLRQEAAVGYCANNLTGPYGYLEPWTEQAYAWAREDRSAINPRYFKAHPGGWVGEAPFGVPNNLFLYIAQAAPRT